MEHFFPGPAIIIAVREREPYVAPAGQRGGEFR
jgi:hypothetical protein